MNFLLHLVFLATFIFVFIVSIVILRPFRVHKKRPVTTISLKVSYLIYLAVFLFLAYLVLFYSGQRADSDQRSGKDPFMIYYIAVILSFIIPNLGIMLRRKFSSIRIEYNIIFTAINLFTTLVLAFIIYTIPWEV